MSRAAPERESVRTYCRICEALCGLVATVEDGTLTELRPNREHPLSQGFACPKGIAMKDVVNDPDRLLNPLRRKPGLPRRRGGPEQFEPVSWDEALDDIAGRLRGAIRSHGGDSVGAYLGNPVHFSYAPPMFLKGLIDAVGSPHFYNPASQDCGSRGAASAYLYGSALSWPIPDLNRTGFLLMVGANPFVSHGSLMTAPRIRDTLGAIPKRGGRVVVVDPRRTETARAFEHVQVHPDSDAWLLGAMLRVIFDEGLEDRDALHRQARGAAALRAMVAADTFTCEEAERRSGVPAQRIRELAREFAGAPSSAAYGRVGTCRGRHGTLVVFLLDALNVVTGNFDRPGGSLLGQPLTPAALARNEDSFGTWHGRVGGFPEAFGVLPSGLMAKEMLTGGKGQLRLFFNVGGNPLLSVPNPLELEEGLGALDLMVSIDIYLSETASCSDYVLPATTFLEKHDIPLLLSHSHTTPYVQATEPVIAPRGEARDEWRIIDDIARRAGLAPYSHPALRALARLGIRPGPRRLVDIALRLGPRGDLFGLRRGGLSLAHLAEQPNGVVLGEHQPTGQQHRRIAHKDRRVHLDVPEIAAEARRLGEHHVDDPAYPLALISLRELRSHNSWMHNVGKLLAGRSHAARIHPGDAARLGVGTGDAIRVVSRDGAITTRALVSDEIVEGAVAVPHGWGHDAGGWRTARAAGGPNLNLLASSDPDQLERLSGMTLLDGIPVRIERAGETVGGVAA